MGNYQLFPKNPVLSFSHPKHSCSCGCGLKVQKTSLIKIRTLHIGEFTARETIKKCVACKRHYHSEELASLVPYGGTFGFDIIVYIGMAVFVQHKNNSVIQHELAQQNIHISLRHISYLSLRFIVYLSIAHRECQDKIKQHMHSNGGYLLHLDGTCEGSDPHIFSAIDAVSDFVLDNQKMPTENAQCISTMLRRLKFAYNDPLAIVSDMGSSIANAVKNIFPGTKHYICHYHFLRDLGKDLFDHEHSTVRRHIKTHRVRSALRKTARELKYMIDNDEPLNTNLANYLEDDDSETLKPIPQAYILISWIIEASSASNGYGFPFDQPHLDFYLRLEEAYPQLKILKNKGVTILPLIKLGKVLSDSALASTAARIQQKVAIFNKLRHTMRIACPEQSGGLNDGGDDNLDDIENKTSTFLQSKEVQTLVEKNISYKKMIQQFEKYWDRLFAAPITIKTPDGEVIIQPQRTNNNMEQSFRYLKKGERQKTGQKNLNKAMKAMLADTLLIRNLDKPDYMELLLNGKSNLIERFADIDIKLVHQQEKENKARWQKYPRRMARLFKIPNLPQKLLKKQAA
jgi:hypothetical protein